MHSALGRQSGTLRLVEEVLTLLFGHPRTRLDIRPYYHFVERLTTYLIVSIFFFRSLASIVMKSIISPRGFYASQGGFFIARLDYQWHVGGVFRSRSGSKFSADEVEEILSREL